MVSGRTQQTVIGVYTADCDWGAMYVLSSWCACCGVGVVFALVCACTALPQGWARLMQLWRVVVLEPSGAVYRQALLVLLQACTKAVFLHASRWGGCRGLRWLFVLR